jgi:hypothetical protein
VPDLAARCSHAHALGRAEHLRVEVDGVGGARADQVRRARAGSRRGLAARPWVAPLCGVTQIVVRTLSPWPVKRR